MDGTWEKGSLQLSGTEMEYIAFGSGSRNLVVLPELSFRPLRGVGGVLARKYRIFEGEWRVWFLDAKENLPDICTAEDLAEDAAVAMQKLGIDRADVLGISMGGMVAQYLALRHPELAAKLVLAVTLSRSNAAMTEAAEKWATAAAAGDYESVARDMLTRVYSEAFVARYGKVFPMTAHMEPLRDPRQFVRLARACLTCDTYDALPSLRCPALVIGGRQDRVVTGEASVEMAERIGCPLYMYENLGHSAFEEGTDFVQRVYDFLKKEGPERNLTEDGNEQTALSAVGTGRVSAGFAL
ncbi:MAG: alpha/beta hydrolase [Clostridia bacterium]|nr:alpha/beta hydrolase [Clostridia bacterium]